MLKNHIFFFIQKKSNGPFLNCTFKTFPEHKTKTTKRNLLKLGTLVEGIDRNGPKQEP